MVWLSKNKRAWRTAVLMLLGIAMLGPWTYERIYVPAAYTCSGAFSIRVEGNFCAMPLSGVQILSWVWGAFIQANVELFSGSMTMTSWGRDILFTLLLFLPLLPFLSFLFMLRRGDRRRWQLFLFTAWGLAAGSALFLALPDFSRGQWLTVWGIWLYIAGAAGALALETLTIVTVKRKIDRGAPRGSEIENSAAN